MKEEEFPPPPEDFPPPPPDIKCPFCGNEIFYIKLYGRWYCYGCQKYAPPDFGKGKFQDSAGRKSDVFEEKKKAKILEELIKLSKGGNKSPVVKEKIEEIESVLKVTIPKLPKGMDFVRKISCVIFYPRGYKSIKNEAISRIVEIIYKNRIHIILKFTGTFEYEPEKREVGFFLKVLEDVNVKSAFVIGAFEKKGEDEFMKKLEEVSVERGFCIGFVPFENIKQGFQYLNILLDFANFKKEKIDCKLIKEGLGLFE